MAAFATSPDLRGLVAEAPTKEELKHHYLWRIRRALPDPGMIGVFDRSQYEDVLVVRVEQLVPVSEWNGRYDEINTFEQKVAEAGTTIIITTHFMEEAEYCDRFMIQDNGHLLAIGSPSDIRKELGRPKADMDDIFIAIVERAREKGEGA